MGFITQSLERDELQEQQILLDFKQIAGPPLQEFIKGDAEIKVHQIKLLTEILKRLNQEGMQKIDNHFTYFVKLMKKQEPTCLWPQMIRAFDFGEQSEQIILYLQKKDGISHELSSEILTAIHQ